MYKGLKTLLIVVGVTAVLGGLWVVDNFIYPLSVENPNFSDVEKAFAKLQFPSDWVEISSSENRGMFGRGCDPFNDAGCFHKSKTFKVPDSTSAEDVKSILKDAGCPGVIETDSTKQGEKSASKNLECGVGSGVQLASSQRGPEAQVYVVARTY